ncbi:unnamed protein product [Heligmosomoides polygyrus]|uniref:Reverse transcriptase domain-containing protein n=1 Tax=Heligmosomoides polygyrus TaxID=6339 RepID=A0A183GBD6_HELPZ|nr:unnamed protein product [Heligmosomoides polygyrus]
MVEVVWHRRNELRRAVLEAGLPDRTGSVNETWRRVTETILRCARKPLAEQREERGDKAAWFWNEEVQAALKRLAKAAVAKAKSADMDALYEKLDEPQGEKFAIRLAKARHRASLDIRVVKTVKSADGRVLRKPVEVRKRWEEYFKKLLNEEFPRREVQEEQLTEGPIPSWTQEEVRSAIGKMKFRKAAGPDGVPIVPIFKQKGDASECSNYRGIKLIPHTMKVYERLVDSRLR